jgi:5-hydroxyisourate hydrolase-like protein (transthyretin family)
MSGWVEAFVVIAAVAIFMQTVILGVMFWQIRITMEQLTRIVTDLNARLDPILTRVTRIVDDSEDRIASIMGDAAEITRLARSQAQKVDRVFTDSVERLRVQVIRADHILTGALEVIEETGSKFRKTLWGPVQQASAILRGLKVGLDYLRGDRTKKDSSPETQDEELFI